MRKKENKPLWLIVSLLVLVFCFVTGRNVPELFNEEQYEYQTEQFQNEEAGDESLSEAESEELADETSDLSEIAESSESEEELQFSLDREGTYTSKEDVAAYLYLYQELPSNFITKDEAKELGWVNSKGNLHEVAPGMSIGGDYFGNYEGKLPEADGRDYYECDINYTGGYRGGERIVYSDDGLIYYTGDHYETFELLYGEE